MIPGGLLLSLALSCGHPPPGSGAGQVESSSNKDVTFRVETVASGARIIRVVLDGRRVVSRKIAGETYGRIRDVAEGPDGSIYFSTANRDRRGAPAKDDDRIILLVAVKEIELDLLGKNRALAPADNLQGWEAVMVDQLEVAFCVVHHVPRGMMFEAEKNLEHCTCNRRPTGNMQQVSAGINHSRQLIHAIFKRNIFQCPTRDDHVESVIRERK